MSQIAIVCFNLHKKLAKNIDSKQLEQIIEYVKGIDALLDFYLENAALSKDSFSLNAAQFSDDDSWESYHRFCGVINGTQDLQSDYYSFLKLHSHQWFDLDDALDEMISYFDTYRFDDLYRQDFGDCSIETLVSYKKRVIEILNKKDILFFKKIVLSRQEENLG